MAIRAFGNPKVRYNAVMSQTGLGAATAAPPGAATKLTVPTGVSGPGVWDLLAQGALTLNIGNTYDIGASGADVEVTIHMWGAGGGSGRGPTNPGGEPASGGGGGGYTTGTMTISSGTTYKAVVGNARGNGPAVPWGDPAASGNPVSPPYSPTNQFHSGGYTGIFATSVSAPNARLMAGGGGLGGYNDGGTQGGGGGGGGTTGADGGGGTGGYSGPPNGAGGTQPAGGAGGTSPHTNGAAGTALTGGQGGERGGSGAAGGAGGSGWYGGGGGAGQTSINTDGGGGGGGSSYIHPSITGGSTTQAGRIDAANDSSPYYVSGRAKGGIYPGPPAGSWNPDMWGSPGTITFVTSG